MLMKKFIGKPYAGKPHVRIDEGAGKEFSPSRSTLPKSFALKKITAENTKNKSAEDAEEKWKVINDQ